jgi:hypothetical protein
VCDKHRITAHARLCIALFAADLKVIVSFITVLTTLENQFGVVWPQSFARALDAMSIFSLDFGAVLGGFCVVEISFYQRLVSSTLLLLVLVATIIVGSRVTNRAEQGIFVAIYLLLFAYPVISVKIVEAFACHEVEGVRYLRVDYSVRCDTHEWKMMAAYAGVWGLVYVIGFPLFVLYKLWSYRTQTTLGTSRLRHYKHVDSAPEHVSLRFLLQDYKSCVPMLLWEGEYVYNVFSLSFPLFVCLANCKLLHRPSFLTTGIEMIRKLLLSVVGSFWSTKSTMCVVTACLISVSFLCLHINYQPFK